MNLSETDPPAEVSGGPIDLSAAPAFRLGGLEILPSTREVRIAGRTEHLAEPRVLQVLIALVSASGAVVSRDTLIQRCWDGRIVGEDAINRAIAKTRQLAGLSRPPAFTIETIPRVGYRLLVAPASTVASPDLEAPAPSSPLGRRGVLAAGVAVIAAGASGVGYWALRGPKAEPLVAVLPFDNLSPDPQMGYFADGLSEDILNALIRGGGVRVTSRTSSFTFRGAAKAKAADALKADYLLDGSVSREGGRLRVNAHLADVARQQTLWSETYDRDVGQGLAIEDEVAGKVAAALKVQFTAAGPAIRAVDPVAYDLYLRGREATRVHTKASLQQGSELLRSSVALAPNFSPAWFELAKNYWRNGYLESIPEQRRGFELGRQAARRAIALDSRNAAAFGVITQMTPAYGHWREIDLGLSHALSIAPNDPNLLLWRCIFLFQTGRLDAALTWARRAQAVDPLELFANHRLCEVLVFVRRFADAEAIAARLAAIWPDQLAAYWDRVWLLIGAGRDSEAVALLGDKSHRPRNETEEYAVLSQATRVARNAPAQAREAAGRALLALAALGTGYASNSVVMLARLGLFDETVELARALYLQKGSITISRGVQFLSNNRFPPHGEADAFYLFHPFVTPLRRSGRLKEIFDGIGLTDLWRVAGGPDA